MQDVESESFTSGENVDAEAVPTAAVTADSVKTESAPTPREAYERTIYDSLMTIKGKDDASLRAIADEQAGKFFGGGGAAQKRQVAVKPSIRRNVSGNNEGVESLQRDVSSLTEKIDKLHTNSEFQSSITNAYARLPVEERQTLEQARVIFSKKSRTKEEEVVAKKYGSLMDVLEKAPREVYGNVMDAYASKIKSVIGEVKPSESRDPISIGGVSLSGRSDLMFKKGDTHKSYRNRVASYADQCIKVLDANR